MGISTVQICYDDGVTGSSCSDTINTQSPTENYILSLNPDALYTFRDDDFSTQVLDVSGNAHHLTKQVATASRGAALRSTHPGAFEIPLVSLANIGTLGVMYSASGYLDALLAGATESVFIIGFKVVTSDGSPDSLRIFGVHNNNGIIGSTNDILTSYIDNTADTLKTYERHTTGGFAVETADSVLDNTGRIMTWRWSNSLSNEFDTSKKSDGSPVNHYTSSFNYTRDTLTRSTQLGHTSSKCGYNVLVDLVAVWADTVVTDSQLSQIHALYTSEMV